MKNKFILLISVLVIILGFFSLVNAAHFIVGFANNASDGMGANDHTVVLWKSSQGVSDNVTDVIGPNGNSGSDNIYLIDCELLDSPCTVGDEVKVMIINNGDNYTSLAYNLSVSGSGFDVMENITLLKSAGFISLVADDNYLVPEDQIDLTAASTKIVSCFAVYKDTNNEAIYNASSEFYNSGISFLGDENDSNYHYANQSCQLNYEYGDASEISVNCTYNVWYYADNSNWNCIVRAYKNITDELISIQDSSYINPLLALEVPDSISFGLVNISNVSKENTTNITNFGNVAFNISLRGYAVEEGDNLSMNCTRGLVKNISISYQRYNYTASNLNPSIINITDFFANYTNLTSSYGVIRNFNLGQRKNDIINDATNLTYWRIYVPEGVAGECQGNIVYGAIRAGGY